jgi:hypothetical protein
MMSYPGANEASAAKNELLNVSAFPCVKPGQSFSNYLTIELLVLKEMTGALADLFDLEVPLLHKESVHASGGQVDL